MITRFGVAVLALAWILQVPAASAQKRYELQDLVKQCDIAFHGKVVAIQNEPVPEKGTAFTHVIFTIDRFLINRTGKPIPDWIDLVFAGGRVGDTVVQFSGVPRFAIGDEAVVFAQHDGKRYLTPVLGGEQGVLRVLRDRTDGTAYPLLPGRRGIVRVHKGSLESADPVQSISGGVVQWKEMKPALPDVQRVPAPTPVPGSGALEARDRTTPEPVRPERLAKLPDLFRGIADLYGLLRTTRPAEGR